MKNFEEIMLKPVVKEFIDKRHRNSWPLWEEIGIEKKIELIAETVEALLDLGALERKK